MVACLINRSRWWVRVGWQQSKGVCTGIMSHQLKISLKMRIARFYFFVIGRPPSIKCRADRQHSAGAGASATAAKKPIVTDSAVHSWTRGKCLSSTWYYAEAQPAAHRERWTEERSQPRRSSSEHHGFRVIAVIKFLPEIEFEPTDPEEGPGRANGGKSAHALSGPHQAARALNLRGDYSTNRGFLTAPRDQNGNSTGPTSSLLDPEAACRQHGANAEIWFYGALWLGQLDVWPRGPIPFWVVSTGRHIR